MSSINIQNLTSETSYRKGNLTETDNLLNLNTTANLLTKTYEKSIVN